MVNQKWHLKFNGGNPVWLDEHNTIVRYATTLEIYEHSTEEEKHKIDDLFGNPTTESV